MIMKKRIYTVTTIIIILFNISCTSKPIGWESSGEDSCIPPQATTFTSIGVDISLVQLTLENFAMGGVNIKTTPEVISLFSKAAVDPDLNNYIYCLAIKHNHYTPEQAAWLESLSRFSTTNPTPDQMQKWQDTHPFPQKTPAERLEIK